MTVGRLLPVLARSHTLALHANKAPDLGFHSAVQLGTPTRKLVFPAESAPADSQQTHTHTTSGCHRRHTGRCDINVKLAPVCCRPAKLITANCQRSLYIRHCCPFRRDDTPSGNGRSRRLALRPVCHPNQGQVLCFRPSYERNCYS